MDEPLCEESPDMSTWGADQLIARVKFLEQQLKEQTTKYNSTVQSPRSPSPARKPKNARVNREFDPSKYSTRFIALKFAYLGQRYNGLEFHPNNKTPLPTVEEELWKALNKARLVFPTPNTMLGPDEPNWEGCDYSKCGRTDKGVSAFGQVIGVRVRSNRPINRTQKPASSEDAVKEEEPSHRRDIGTAAPPAVSDTSLEEDATSTTSSTSEPLSDGTLLFNSIKDEIPYCQVLNRLLPPDIRMLAWCPNPPLDFSARFSCKERRYKYFFTQPAFAPTVGSEGLHGDIYKQDRFTSRRREGWLDISAMREASHKFIGLHDFRNFCKIDSSKQIDNFERRIFHADIEEIDRRHGPVGYVGKPGFQQYEHPDNTPNSPPIDDPTCQPCTPTIYTFTLHGSAFLWHQVRHMAAILFLIGQGLEPPSLVDDLLDISKTPGRPQYEMADDAPLVLWDCIFPREGADNSSTSALEWVYVGDESAQGVNRAGGAKSAGKHGYGGVVDDLWKVWRGRKMDEVLAGSLLDVVVGRGGNGDDSTTTNAPVMVDASCSKSAGSQKVFHGGDAPRFVGTYVPVMRKPRMESVEVLNARYAKRKGFEQDEESREAGFRRVVREERDSGVE